MSPSTVAAMTTWHILAIVLTGVVALCIPVVIHHLAIDVRERRARRRDLELLRARRDAHQERKWARIASDDQAIAAARAERDEARRLAVQMLGQVDHLQGQLAAAVRERDSARQFGRRLERDRFALTTLHVELEQTARIPVLPATEVPAIEAPARRRPVLA